MRAKYFEDIISDVCHKNMQKTKTNIYQRYEKSHKLLFFKIWNSLQQECIGKQIAELL